jgi:hypothetical protein
MKITDITHHGISVIPIRQGEKRPLVEWTQFQSSIVDDATIEKWQTQTQSFAMVNGVVSGNLETIDFDTYHQEIPKTFRLWIDTLPEEVKKVFDTLPVTKTPSGGFHVRYRCNKIEGNQKLYKNSTTGEAIIETRGEGGYALFSEEAGYKLAQGSYTNIPTISEDVRDIFIAVARAFDTQQEEVDQEPYLQKTTHADNDDTPWQWYEQNTSWDEILLSHGWKKLFTSKDTTHWKRPNKKKHTTSATVRVGSDGVERLFVFSSNAEPLQEYSKQLHNSYRKFGAYATLEHNGDYKSASKAVRARMPIKKQLVKVRTVGKVPQEEEDTPHVDFITNAKGDAIPCATNVSRVVAGYECVRYDTFLQKYEIKINGKWEQRRDSHDIEIKDRVSQDYPFLATQGLSAVQNAITKIGVQNSYDSMQTWLTSLKWDGVSRIDGWLHHAFHVENNEYHTSIGANWMKGLVKRIMVPGCKFDYALILQGKQGAKKSTALLTIAGENKHIEFTDMKVREFQQEINGKLVVEFAEAAVFRKSDQETLKSIITRQSETYRPPYARNAEDFPRRCVFAVTANNNEILKDETGNRRWWVVQCGENEADIEWLKLNRDQLFAEAYVRAIEKNETTWEVPADALAEAHEGVRVKEENEDLYMEWWKNLFDQDKAKGVTTRQAYTMVFPRRDKYGEILAHQEIEIKKSTEMSIARFFKVVLKLESRRVRYNGILQTRWFVPEMPFLETTIATEQTEEERHLAEMIKDF